MSRPESRSGLILAVLCTITLSGAPRAALSQDAVLARADSLIPTYSGRPGFGHPTVHRLAEGAYAVTDLYHSRGGKAGVAAGIIFAQQATIFVDAGMTITSGQFLWDLAAARMRDDQQVFLILTHHHSDHLFGMRVFKDRAVQVIGHQIIADELGDDAGFYKTFIARMEGWTTEEADEILGDVVLSAPDLTIEADTVLVLGGEQVHILATPGHVADEIVVYHPRSKTLFAGDAIYEGMLPNTRFGGAAAWRTWIRHLERLSDLDIRMVVPGHGKLSSVAVIDENIRYLSELLREQT